MEHDEQDAAPARVGMSQDPKWFITLAIMPDGNFAADGNCMDDEMIVRALLHKGSFEVDRLFGRKAFERAAKSAKDQRDIATMLGPGDAQRLDKRLKELRG